MKLIDLLVQELPNLGGWPEHANFAAQDFDGEVCFYTEKPVLMSSGRVWAVNNKCREGRLLDSASDFATAVITREQYDVAITALLQPIWNGEGLPPVGCEAELVNFFGEEFPEFVGEPGEKVRIIGNGFTNGCPVAFYEADGGRGNILAYAVESCFRPIRAEVECKREDAIQAIASFAITYRDAAEIYDAIAAGKIPHITLK